MGVAKLKGNLEGRNIFLYNENSQRANYKNN